jgi:endogenous inhibitor of DNA gyrase (YacG/DUF329 family)
MLNLPIYEADDLYKHGLTLLEKELPFKLRLMGLRYSHLCLAYSRVTHLCPRGKPHGDLDKFFSAMKEADIPVGSSRKRKMTEMNAEQIEAEAAAEEESKNPRCPCPICGAMVLEEDINNHLDVCLNRTTVLELVRETDKEKKKSVNGRGRPQSRRPFFGKS